jgi:Zn-dependent protease with chaperone function
VLNLFILYLSRLREYYADRHSVSVVNNGAQKLGNLVVCKNIYRLSIE